MPVRFERKDDLLRIILEGLVTLDDMYAGVDEIYAAAVPSMVLWDMQLASVSEEDDIPGKLRAFSQYATEKGKDRKDGRVALLAPTALQYGLSRMSTAYAENNQAAYAMQVFRTEAEAMTFLRGGD